MTDSQDYRLYLMTEFKLVHQKLDSIETQVRETNGTVKEHDRIIAQNIPHTIAQCSQAKTIDELKEWQAEQDGVETAEESFMKRSQIAAELEATKRRDKKQSLFNAITAILTIIAVSVTIYFSSQSSRSAKAAEREGKTTNEIFAPVLKDMASPIIRGSTYDPFVVDTTKKARFFDTMNFDRLLK